jgi:PAS domain S-box-containing protein
MRILSLKRLAPYGVAVLSCALATIVRLEFNPVLGESAPLLIIAIAVIIASWFGGFWPGLLAIILSLLTIDYFLFAPTYSIFSYDSRLDQIFAVSFGIFGILGSLNFARLRESIKAKMETRERFRLLVEGVKDYAIFMLDAQGRVVSWRPGVERINGYRADEIVGRDFSVFFTPEDIESGEPQRILEIAAAEGRYEGSGWQMRKDGSRFWGSGIVAAIDDGGRLRGFTIIARDATERKIMEETVRFLADLNQALLPLADPEEIVAVAARMLGEYMGVDRCAYGEIEADEKHFTCMGEYTRGEASSRVVRFRVDDLNSEAQRIIRANYPHVVNDFEAEPIARRDLSGCPHSEMRAMISVPLSKKGRYVARMAVSQKTPRHWSPWEIELVTKVANRCWEAVERARAVRNMRKSEERYREELERLLREEKAARADAEAANRMKDEFLTTISHELRTPLTSILGWARMLTSGRLNGPQAQHALEVIEQSARSQTRLVEDVLDTSRIITGRLTLDAQPVAIEHIFHAAVDVIRPTAEAKGISLSSAVDEPDGVVLGDANRLQQAIWNLLSNAVKFTNEGGRIEARLARAEGQIEIAVKDTGIGIEPRFLSHVFDRFSQADSSSTRTYGGLGIGLAIVRHIVEMHGGGVSASSPGKGQGATFKIRLPLISAGRTTQLEVPRVEAPTPTKEPMVLEDIHRLDGVRVLLVEDDPVTLDLLKFIFDEFGADVITATSVDEALEALERFIPDALVSDIAMPDRDGCDLVREVRTREPERGGNIPAVAVTAYARVEDRVRALTAGFQMHITKPIVPDELIAVVASLTGHN